MWPEYMVRSSLSTASFDPPVEFLYSFVSPASRQHETTQKRHIASHNMNTTAAQGDAVSIKTRALEARSAVTDTHVLLCSPKSGTKSASEDVPDYLVQIIEWESVLSICEVDVDSASFAVVYLVPGQQQRSLEISVGYLRGLFGFARRFGRDNRFQPALLRRFMTCMHTLARE